MCVLNKSQYESSSVPYIELHTFFRYTHIFLCRSPNPQEELVLTLCQHSLSMPSRTLCDPSGTGVPWVRQFLARESSAKYSNSTDLLRGEPRSLPGRLLGDTANWVSELPHSWSGKDFLISGNQHELCGCSSKTSAGLSRSLTCPSQ